MTSGNASDEPICRMNREALERLTAIADLFLEADPSADGIHDLADQVAAETAGLGITNGSVDVGQVYRVLRDLEAAGLVSSSWTTGSGPARRDYELTDAGYAALDEWAAVMKERTRLVGEFDARYLESVAAPRR